MIEPQIRKRPAFALPLLLTLSAISLALPTVASGQGLPYRSGFGSELVYQCKAYVRITESRSDQEDAGDDISARSECSGYVEGFMDGVGSGSPVPSKEWEATGFCLGGTSVDTLIKVYLAFMEKNPKYLDEYKGKTLRMALHDTYPCQK